MLVFFLTIKAVVAYKTESITSGISLDYAVINIKICMWLCLKMIASVNIFIGFYRTKWSKTAKHKNVAVFFLHLGIDRRERYFI